MVSLRTPRLPLPGIGFVTAPIRMAAAGTRMALKASGSLAALAVEAVGGAPVRRYSVTAGRCWIEVRGLGGDRTSEIGKQVLKAVKATPGGGQVVLTGSIARVVVTVDSD